MIAMKETHFHPAGFKHNTWDCHPDFGQTLDGMMKEEYWAHVAPKLTVFDKICVYGADGTWYAELMVRDRGKTWAKVGLLYKVDLAPVVRQDYVVEDEYTVKWSGPQLKYRVLRNKDNHVMQEGIVVKEDAIAWVREHTKAAAA